MALANELWAAGIRAQFLQVLSASLTTFYEFAHTHHIPWLAVIERSTFSAAATVKVGSFTPLGFYPAAAMVKVGLVLLGHYPIMLLVGWQMPHML